ncbi:ATP-binding cassette domain-containing protein [Microbacterium sp.]|uniref:methionine ABC transporter ATP-binding protein n=1 Tax=Microbacterium sp. TaxID=51671 RepID=UPI002810D0BC|nr:ATP-binding cassette domain-containing protein [Microbacterium sp.]
MITIENVSKIYPGASFAALDDVSLHVERGEIFGIVGESGAGKSTLIRTVNMLERPTSGRVVVDGADLTALDEAGLRAARQNIGMVFQHFNLLSSRTALGNVDFALEGSRVPAARRRSRALEILDLVGLADRADYYPAQLSGGQKQRVGIARALAAEPRVLLSDEATSALDPETTASILDLLSTVNRELGLTVLLITHEMDVIKRICHSAALIENGRIVESGRVLDLVRTPGSPIGRALFTSVDDVEHAGGTLAEVTFTGASANDPVITSLAREFDLDIAILGGEIDSFRDQRVGRLHVRLPGDAAASAPLLARLTDRGFVVDVIAEEATPFAVLSAGRDPQ